MHRLTPRLSLFPLSPAQMQLWVHDLPALEAALGCTYRGEPLSGPFLQVVCAQASAAAAAGTNYMWHSFWLLMRRSDRSIVGSAVWKGAPDASGRVEIGYGLGQAFYHQGYMTEAVSELCRWALDQPAVTSVLAETDPLPQGAASQRVLKRCGFLPYPQKSGCWWCLK